LVRSELEAIAKAHPDRFQLEYTLDRPPAFDWKYSTGFITKEMVEKHLYTNDDNNKKQIQYFMCGPPPMIKFACIPNLEALGFTDQEMFSF
jgi:NAD(P)H-flavin reductase